MVTEPPGVPAEGTPVEPPEPSGFVHIYKGRNNHVSIDSQRRLTRCGQRWVAEVVGPPASERPVCKECADA